MAGAGPHIVDEGTALAEGADATKPRRGPLPGNVRPNSHLKASQSNYTPLASTAAGGGVLSPAPLVKGQAQGQGRSCPNSKRWCTAGAANCPALPCLHPYPAGLQLRATLGQPTRHGPLTQKADRTTGVRPSGPCPHTMRDAHAHGSTELEASHSGAQQSSEQWKNAQSQSGVVVSATHAATAQLRQQREAASEEAATATTRGQPDSCDGSHPEPQRRGHWYDWSPAHSL